MLAVFKYRASTLAQGFKGVAGRPVDALEVDLMQSVPFLFRGLVERFGRCADSGVVMHTMDRTVLFQSGADRLTNGFTVTDIARNGNAPRPQLSRSLLRHLGVAVSDDDPCTFPGIG